MRPTALAATFALTLLIAAGDPAQAATRFQGLDHDPLGNATLALTADGRLQIGNLGPDGADGVRVQLGQARGFHVRGGSAQAERVGFTMTRFEDVPVVSDGKTVKVDILRGPGSSRLLLGAENLEVAQVRVETFRAGVPVDVAEFAWPPPPGLVTVEQEMTTAADWDYRMLVRDGGNTLEFLAHRAGPTVPMTITGGVPAQADRVVITAIGTDMPALASVDIVAEVPGDGGGIKHLHAEGVIHRDIAARGTGGGGTSVQCWDGVCRLQVADLDGAGQDGVEIGLPPTIADLDDPDDAGTFDDIGAEIRFDPPLAVPAAVGSEWKLVRELTLGDQTAEVEVGLRRDGDAVTALARFGADLNVAEVTVEALAGSQVLASSVLAVGPGELVPSGTIYEPDTNQAQSAIYTGSDDKAAGDLAVTIVLDAPAPIQPAGQTDIVTADRLRVSATLPAAPEPGAPRLRILGAAIPDFGITDIAPLATVTAAPITSPADAALATLAASPNPFNPQTLIALATARASTGEVAVYDLRGRAVRMLHRGALPAGEHTFRWDGTDDGGRTVAAGAYVVQFRGDDATALAKVMLVK